MALFSAAIFGVAPIVGAPQVAKHRLRRNIELAAEETVGRAKSKITGSRSTNPGSVLGRRTGVLAASIGKVIIERGDDIEARIGPQGVVYGRIHELGGTIRPKTAPFLVFTTDDGTLVYTKEVKIPKRPYLAPALEDMLPRIKELIGDAFAGSVK